jgi:hypothetical protein
MRLFGKRCFMCGIYIKSWKRRKHEGWHADQVIYITKLLCTHCFTEHGKPHFACGKDSSTCRCACNQVDAE